MSKLVVRILLSVFVVPLAAAVYLVTWALLEDTYTVFRRGVLLYAGAGAMTWIFVAGYWIGVWRGALKRTSYWGAGAVGATLIAPVAGALVAAALGMTDAIDRELAAFIGSALTPFVWMILTLFFWVRSEPASEAGAAVSVRCPACGYDLRGQREARCPECGAAFSIGELLEKQPGREMKREFSA
ncbi:MAG TPA: hypothetical protein VEA69_18980 [Tepidisphaeraceae bacterium]|nr:hypothetical protein [Tepidisphaeraceae bacterium]